MTQHSCETAWLWNSVGEIAPVKEVPVSQLHAGTRPLHCSGVIARTGETQSSMTLNVSSTPVEVKLADIDKSSCCQSLMVHSYANKDSKSSHFDWSKKKKKKKPVLIGQKEPILFFQLKCKWGYNCTTLIGQGKSQAFGWNKMLETLIRVAQTAGTVQEAASSLQLFPEAQREWEPLFCNDYKILLINFNPVSHQEFFFF